MIRYSKKLITGAGSLIKGMIITLKNLLTPAITVQYPKEKLAMSERYRGLVDLSVQKCIVCYQCVKICPTGCLSIAHKQAEGNKKTLEKFGYIMELCCFCGLCQQVCPTGAVYMNKIYEIAVYDRARLKINLLNPEKYNEWINATVK